MGVIRIETDGATGMSEVRAWLARHRNQVITIDPDKSVMLGVPITGARAVLVAALLDNGIGGVVRALTSLAGRPIRLIFDVRARGGLAPDEVRVVGAQVLDSISRQIAGEDLVSRVA